MTGEEGEQNEAVNGKETVAVKTKSFYDKEADTYVTEIFLTKQGLRLIEEFTVRSAQETYNDGKNNRQRFLVRKIVASAFGVTGRFGIFFDTEGGKRRKVYLTTYREAEQFVEGIKQFFTLLTEARVHMKRTLRADVVLKQRAEGE